MGNRSRNSNSDEASTSVPDQIRSDQSRPRAYTKKGKSRRRVPWRRDDRRHNTREDKNRHRKTRRKGQKRGGDKTKATRAKKGMGQDEVSRWIVRNAEEGEGRGRDETESRTSGPRETSQDRFAIDSGSEMRRMRRKKEEETRCSTPANPMLVALQSNNLPSALGMKAKRCGCRRKGQGQPSLSQLG